MKKKVIDKTKWRGLSLLQLLALIAAGGVILTAVCIFLF
jgi:hypothetical protein